MLKIKCISFFIMIFSALILAQNEYHVSYFDGNDSYPGTIEKPWQTIDKVNSINFQPGDIIKFECGNTWTGEQLLITHGGDPGKSIVYGSYIGKHGSAKPIISMRYAIPETPISDNWSPYSGNVWRCNISGGGGSPWSSLRLFQSDGTDFGGEASSSVVNAITMGYRHGSQVSYTTGLNSTNNWYYDGKYLYIYSSSNPAQQFYFSNNFDQYLGTQLTVWILNADYITLDGLDLRYGYNTIRVNESDYLTIQNCNIGFGTDRYGIQGEKCNFGILKNNSIVSVSNNKWKYTYPDQIYSSSGPIIGGYGNSASDGFMMSGSNWKIYNNYFANWYHACIYQGGHSYDETNYNEVYDNYFTSANIDYGRAFGWSLENGAVGHMSYNRFYRNIVHNMPTVSQIAGDHNYVYYNIFDSTLIQPYGRDDIAQTVCMVPSGSNPICQNNYFFNNTVYYSDNQNFYLYGDNNIVLNNLFLDPNQPNPYNANSTGFNAFQISSGNYSTVMNNLVYSSISKTKNDNMFSINGKSYNALNVNGISQNIIDNDQYIGNINDLINLHNFSIKNDIAMAKGTAINNLIPEGFKDIYGNIVDHEHPNIGAVDNRPQFQETTGFKVYLEGPYKDGQMSSMLNENGYIPKSQSYNVSPWNYSGNESVLAIPKNIVDWILVELRSSTSPSSTVSRQAAFLRNDGSITALDGISPLTFSSDLAGSYYIVIKHRNHLSIMSSQPVKLTNSTIQYDFTTSEDKTFGQNSMVNLGNGAYGMYGGDTNGDGVIDEKDVVDVSQMLFSSGYFEEDSDMNSPVNVLDYKLPNNNMTKSTNVQ